MQIIHMKFTRVKILDLQHDYTPPPPFSLYPVGDGLNQTVWFDLNYQIQMKLTRVKFPNFKEIHSNERNSLNWSSLVKMKLKVR